MKVAVKRAALIELIREALEVPGEEVDAPVSVTEPPLKEPPVGASNEIEQEGLFELPPVEDEEYVPKNIAALSRAAFALAKMVPPKQLDRFYSRLHDLTQDAIALQKEEEMGMSTVEERLRQKIRALVMEAAGDDADISGMLADLEEDEPTPKPGDPDYEAYQRSLRRYGDIFKKRADQSARGKNWGDISFKPKKKEVEFFDEPGYRAEPVEDMGGYGHPGTLEFVASEVEGLNTPSAVRQFLEDPRKINLMDKIKFLISMPEKDRERVMIGAAADFITALEKGKQKEPISHEDPVIRKVIDLYVSDLEEEGAVDDEDAKALRSRTEYVVELDSFKHYMTDFFDHNFDDLLKYGPFRMHLKKYWQKMMRSDPELQRHVEKRKVADIERARKKKAAAAARKKK
ncbi:MAG: hypothetical protein ACW96N_04605 [Candidatus Thorarchaeota archaeon]|jgi:hypothetical protein